MYAPDGTRTLVGAEVIVDKDRASALLAREIEADVFVMATDVDGVYLDWGTPDARRLERTTPARAPRPRLPRRLDGAEGRGGVRVRRADGRHGRHRRAGRHRGDRRRPDGHDRPARIARRSPAADPVRLPLPCAARCVSFLRSALVAAGAVLLAAGASAFGIDTDQPPPPGVVGTPYSFTFVLKAGAPPYAVWWTPGRLAPGLKIESDGTDARHADGAGHFRLHRRGEPVLRAGPQVLYAVGLHP